MNSNDFTPISKRPIQEWEIRISNYQSGYNIVLAIRSNKCNFHAWNVANLVTGVGNWGNRFASKGAGFLYGDNDYGIGEPAVAGDVISVSAHVSKEKGSFNGGARAVFASKGPRIDGVIRPEVSAPGIGIISAINSFTTDIDNFPDNNSVVFNDKTYKFYPLSGTSMSSPMVSGVVALMLEANPNLTPKQVKQILKETSISDEYTGKNLPNNTWGWGKVNAHAAVKSSIDLIGLKHGFEKQDNIKIYPNPARDILNIKAEKFYQIRILDIYGREMIISNTEEKSIDISNLERGLYIINFSNDKTIKTFKILFQ